MNQEQAWSGRSPLGQPQVKNPGRKLEIKTKDITSVDHAVPIPVFYGTVKLAGIYIMPVTDFRSVEIFQELGK